MNNKHSTLLAGPAGPTGDRPGPDRVIGILITYLFVAIFFPVLAFAYAVWLSLFTYARLPWWIPAPVAGVLTLINIPFGTLSPNGISKIFGSLGTAFSSLFSKHYSFASVVFHLIATQALFSLWASTTAAMFVIAFKWQKFPRWQEQHLNPGMILKRRYKKTQLAIESGNESPEDSITLGISKDLRDPRFAGGKPGTPYGERVTISNQEGAGHCLIVGGSGSGKSTSMLMGMRDVIRLGRGLVVIDCKGGPDIPAQVAEWADRNGREFFHWSIRDSKIPYTGPADGPAYYDPISRGDASRRKDLLIGSQRWDVEFYKNVVANYLQIAFAVMDLVPALDGVDTFADLSDLLSPSQLLKRSKYIVAEENIELKTALDRIPEIESQALSGIRAMYDRIQTLTSSTAGAWLRKDPEGLRDINFRRVADEGQVVVFSLDSSNYEDTVNLIAGLIIQDLKTLSSELRTDPADLPLHIYIDEFSSIDTTNLLGLLAKARDAKMPVTLATQALADLKRKESTFVDQVLGIVTSFIIHRANAESDARIYAGLSGVVKKRFERVSVDNSSQGIDSLGSTSGTGTRSSEEREDYAIAVGVFQHLPLGNCVYITKSPTVRYVNPVQVIRENDSLAVFKADKPVEVERSLHDYKSNTPIKTYPNPALVEATKYNSPKPEVHDVLEGDKTVGPKRPSRKAMAPGKAAGTPIPIPTISPNSELGKTLSTPMPTSIPPTPLTGNGSKASDDWMMP